MSTWLVTFRIENAERRATLARGRGLIVEHYFWLSVAAAERDAERAEQRPC